MCDSHTDCEKNLEYCSVKKSCEPFAECFLMQDANNKTCPAPVAAPGGDCAACNTTVPYCKGGAEGGCYCNTKESVCHPTVIGGVNICEETDIQEALGVPPCKAT